MVIDMVARFGPSPRIRGEYGFFCGHDSAGVDHPREYGENVLSEKRQRLREGPSPRIRGESPLTLNHLAACRTIPANTGRMQPCSAHYHQRWDHPREYGENGIDISAWMWFPGTIPANTGRMSACTCAATRCTDHPREYGENDEQYQAATATLGPSPRIRGELRDP